MDTPTRPRALAVGLLALVVFLAASHAQAQGSVSAALKEVTDRFDAGFDAGRWQAAAADLQGLLDSGSLSRVQRSEARKYLAQYHMLVTKDNQLAVEVYRDLVADDPSFGMGDLALRGRGDPPAIVLRLFGEAMLKWRQEELERRHAALSATSRGGAMVRSTLLPGTGQFYQGYRGRGYGMIALTGAAVAYAVVSDLNFRSARDDYDNAAEGEDFDRLYRDYETAANRADIALGVVAAAWVYNVLDAALSGPNISGLSKSVAARVQPRRDGRGARLELALAF